jgi:hypothetical protein
MVKTNVAKLCEQQEVFAGNNEEEVEDSLYFRSPNHFGRAGTDCDQE